MNYRDFINSAPLVCNTKGRNAHDKCEAQTFLLQWKITVFVVLCGNNRTRYLPITGGNYQFAQGKVNVPGIVPTLSERNNRTI